MLLGIFLLAPEDALSFYKNRKVAEVVVEVVDPDLLSMRPSSAEHGNGRHHDVRRGSWQVSSRPSTAGSRANSVCFEPWTASASAEGASSPGAVPSADAEASNSVASARANAVAVNRLLQRAASGGAVAVDQADRAEGSSVSPRVGASRPGAPTLQSIASGHTFAMEEIERDRTGSLDTVEPPRGRRYYPSAATRAPASRLSSADAWRETFGASWSSRTSHVAGDV